MNMHMRWAAMLVVGMSLLSLAACNTWDGLGRDFEAAGQSMQEMTD